MVEGQSAPVEIANYKAFLLRVNKALGAYEYDSIVNEEYLLAQVSDFCKTHDITLQSFPEHSSLSEKDFTIYTNVVLARGSYEGLNKLAYFVEKEKKIGRITSIEFEKKKNKETRKHFLQMKMYIQNIKFHRNE